MDARTFLDNFGTIAEAPGGIERLRELVLDLALRGQLTQQEPDDGIVDEELSTIAEVVQPSTLLDPITDGAVPWTIPATWRWVRFKQIVDFAPGKTPPTKDSSYWDEPELGELWASISDMPDSGTLFTTGRAISQKAVTSVMKRPPAPVGALLMSFKLTIGKVCRVGRPTYFNEAIIEIDTPNEATKEFLFRTLRVLALGGSSKAAIKGNTLNKGSITNIPIPFPPLGEQERIVAKVDELMQLCDDLESRQQARHHVVTRLRASALDALRNAETEDDLDAGWSRIHTNWEALTDHPDSIDALRQTILQLAVRGRLVSQDPADEDASRLIERIRLTKQNLAATGRERRLLGTAEDNAAPKPPIAIPEGWAWTRLGEVLGYCRNGISTPNNDEGRGFPLLRISAGTSRFDWLVDLEDCKFADLSNEKAAPYLLDPGDLLACRFNGNLKYVGMVSQVPYTITGPVLHPDKLIRMKAFEVRHDFLRIALNSDVVRAQIEGVASTTAGNIGINGAQLQSLLVPVPPLAEQDRIVAKFFGLLGAIDVLRRRLEQRESVWASLATSSASTLAA